MYSPIENFLICHKFYDKKNRRLSAFADFQGNSLKIYVIACSNKVDQKTKTRDTFSRQFARQALVDYLTYGHLKSYKTTWNAIHPVIYSIPTSVDSYRRDFMSFLYENFFIKEEMQIGVLGTNRMVVADVYQNSTTREIRVVNSHIRIVPEAELKAHEEEFEEQKKYEEKFQAYLEMVGKMNDTQESQNN